MLETNEIQCLHPLLNVSYGGFVSPTVLQTAFAPAVMALYPHKLCWFPQNKHRDLHRDNVFGNLEQSLV